MTSGHSAIQTMSELSQPNGTRYSMQELETTLPRSSNSVATGNTVHSDTGSSHFAYCKIYWFGTGSPYV